MNYRFGLLKSLCLVIIILILMSVVLIGCGNQAIFDPGTFNFTHIHIFDGVEGHCYNITKWWENDGTSIEVRIEGGEGIFCSEGTYQLFESSDICAYCD